mgnify:CR=1 FL=1
MWSIMEDLQLTYGQKDRIEISSDDFRSVHGPQCFFSLGGGLPQFHRSLSAMVQAGGTVED